MTDILEVPVGFDGIAIANSKKSAQYDLSLADIYMALAKDVPGPDGKLIPNPNTTWQDVNPSLPATRIEVLGPPPTSGTRDAFAELALGGGAKTFASLKTLRGLCPGLGGLLGLFGGRGLTLFLLLDHALPEAHELERQLPCSLIRMLEGHLLDQGAESRLHNEGLCDGNGPELSQNRPCHPRRWDGS